MINYPFRLFLFSALLLFRSNGSAQEILSSKLLKTSGCCSSHDGVSNRCQSNGRVICNDGWLDSTCLCEEMNVSTEDDVESPSNISTSTTSGTNRRKRRFSGLLVGNLDYISELIAGEDSFGDASGFNMEINDSPKYLFKIRNSRQRLEVSILRPFRVQLDQIVSQTSSAVTVQGSKPITNQAVGEECQEIVNVEFRSINRVRPFVVVARSVDCLSARFEERWAGETKKKR